MQVQIELPTNFLNDIEYIKKELTNLKQNFRPKEPTSYLTRQEVAKLLHVDISTVHNMSVKGILHKYQISGRILYKRNEVENAIVKLNK